MAKARIKLINPPKKRATRKRRKTTTKGVPKMAYKKRRKSTKKRVGRKVARKSPVRRKRQIGKRKRATVYISKQGKVYAPRRKGRRKAVLKVGTRINGRKRRYRRNPAFSLKRVFNTKLLMNATAVAGGFIIGNYGAKLLRQYLPVQLTATLGQFSGALNIGLGLLVGSMAKNPNIKMGALGMVASGVYDIAQQFLPAQFLGNDMPNKLGPDAWYMPASMAMGADASLLDATGAGVDNFGADTDLLDSAGAGDMVMGTDYYEEDAL